MSLKVLTLEQSEKWDEIVKSFSLHDVYYLSGYVKGFSLHGDGVPQLLYFENQSTRAINVIMKKDIADDSKFLGKLEKDTYFDFSTPYGYGGFIVEGSDIETLEKEYSDYCRTNNIISEFVRFHPVTANYKKMESVYDVEELGNTVCMTLESEEQIWANLSSKNRNMIRKALNSGLKCFWGRDENLIPEFMRLYNMTMDRDNARDYYYFNYDFYQSIVSELKRNALFFYVKLDNKIVSMALILFEGSQAHYHLSAADREYMNLAPTNLLLYETAMFVKHIGCKTLHLGGGLGASEDSLYKFKKAFNRNEDTKFYIGKKIFKQDIYDELTKLNSQGTEGSFFPAYRRS